MSDVLVKGMKMPKSCYSEVYSENGYCPFHCFDYHGGSHCTISACKCLKTRRPKNCPLNLVPEHGRLIDADELVGNISDTYCEECPRTKPIMCRSCEYEDIMDDIENAHTVLEANT